MLSQRLLGTGHYALQLKIGFPVRAGGIIRQVFSAIEIWRAKRRLLGADDGMLKDIGVSRGSVDWVARNGRDNDSR